MLSLSFSTRLKSLHIVPLYTSKCFYKFHLSCFVLNFNIDGVLKNQTILDIKRPIEADLEKFQDVFESIISSDAPLLNRVLRYMIRNKGKQLRPIFVLLSAKAAHGIVSEKAHVGAALVEILHSATLIHDDVIDQAEYRRHMFSVPALWKSKVSILVGDYLLGAGLKLAVDHEAYEMLKELSLAVEEMSKGELIQLERSRVEQYNKEVYLRVIEKKTAALLAAACAIGAQSAEHTHLGSIRQTLYNYGLNLGMAFQIKDDLFDFGEAEVGKPRGNDLREGKKTLPLILAHHLASPGDRRWLEKNVRLSRKRSIPRKRTIEYVKKSGAIEASRQEMLSFAKKAKDALSHLQPSEALTSLIQLVDYSMERTL